MVVKVTVAELQSNLRKYLIEAGSEEDVEVVDFQAWSSFGGVMLVQKEQYERLCEFYREHRPKREHDGDALTEEELLEELRRSISASGHEDQNEDEPG